MPTYDPHDPDHQDDPGSGDFMTHEVSDPGSKKIGYELTDANVKDTAIFLVVLGATLAVVFVLAFGIGKLIFKELARQDGPTNKWSQMAGIKPANLESDPRIQQQQLEQIVKTFPAPRLETDDGNLDVAQMHAREDMLLNHYSWIDAKDQTLRIPIAQAMKLLAQRGLPVETVQPSDEQHMFGDGSEEVTPPLTDGFARTGPEIQMMEAKEQQMEEGKPHISKSQSNVAH